MKTRNKILALAILTALSQSAIAADADEQNCDGSDGLNAWGIWCTEGVQKPTAAGPTDSGTTTPQNSPTDIANLDDFGGTPENKAS